MPSDDLKKLISRLLLLLERYYSENVVLRMVLESITMPGGTKGIPDLDKKLEDSLSDPEVMQVIDEKFAPLRLKVESIQSESDLLELLKQLPTTGKVH